MPTPCVADDTLLLKALAQGGDALNQARFWTDGVNRLLEALGHASGVSRVWIFQLLQLTPEGVLQDYVFEWSSAPCHHQLTQPRFRFFTTLIDDDHYAQMIERRRAGQSHCCITSRLSPGSLRTNLESQGILSMVTVPIMVDGQWWGTLGFDDCERELDWEGGGLNALVVAAELIASALYRHQLNSRKRQVELLQHVAACGIWEIDPTTGATWCSHALLRTLGYPDQYARLPLRRLLAHIARQDRPWLWQQLRSGLQVRQSSWRMDVRLVTAGGTSCWYELDVEARYTPEGRLASLAGLAIDISRRKQGETQALAAAEYDELTGAMNRRGLSRRLQELWATRDQETFYLLLLDIDYFKSINDRYGHPAGDALLRQLVQRLSDELRPQDILVRLGGEEFAIVASCLNERQAQDLAERLRQSISRQPFGLRALPGLAGSSGSPLEVRVPLSISVGVAPLCLEKDLGYSQSIAVAQADQALYSAKESGRDRVVAYWDTFSGRGSG